MIGFVVFVAFAWLTFKMMKLALVECSMCLIFEGKKHCQSALGPDETTALEEAHRSLCAQLTSGVTEVVACQRLNRDDISCGKPSKSLKE